MTKISWHNRSVAAAIACTLLSVATFGQTQPGGAWTNVCACRRFTNRLPSTTSRRCTCVVIVIRGSSGWISMKPCVAWSLAKRSRRAASAAISTRCWPGGGCTATSPQISRPENMGSAENMGSGLSLSYPSSKQSPSTVNIERNEFHGDWNYCIRSS